MTDEFDGKSFDLEKDETKDKDGNESEDDKNDDDLDKEMGELGPDAESLDRSYIMVTEFSKLVLTFQKSYHVLTSTVHRCCCYIVRLFLQVGLCGD